MIHHQVSSRVINAPPFMFIHQDNVMKGITGVETIKRLRDAGYYGPIIGHSASYMSRIRWGCGVSTFIQKGDPTGLDGCILDIKKMMSLSKENK